MVVGRKGGPQNTGIYECYFIWQMKNLRDHKSELTQCLQAPQIKGWTPPAMCVFETDWYITHILCRVKKWWKIKC